MVILVLMRYAGTYVSVNIDRNRYLWGIYGYSCAYALCRNLRESKYR